MLEMLLLAVCLAILTAASLADLRTGEVPETLSTGLAAVVALVCVGSSAYYWDVAFVARPLVWGLAYFAVAYAIFYLGQWGGGDVKLLGGIGALLGFIDSWGYLWPNSTFISLPIPAALTYALNMAILSTPYVLLYTLFMGLRHPWVFEKFVRRLADQRVMYTLPMTLLPLAVAVYFRFFALAYVYSLVPLLVLASAYMRTVEEHLMTRAVAVSELKDWDIIADDVVVDGVKVAAAGNIEGVTPAQLGRIKQLAQEGRIPKIIRTRWGVKFAPVLALAVPITVLAGNVLELLFRLIIESG